MIPVAARLSVTSLIWVRVGAVTFVRRALQNVGRLVLLVDRRLEQMTLLLIVVVALVRTFLVRIAWCEMSTMMVRCLRLLSFYLLLFCWGLLFFGS